MNNTNNEEILLELARYITKFVGLGKDFNDIKNSITEREREMLKELIT